MQCRRHHYLGSHAAHRLSSGFPNTAGMRSSRNRNRCARMPIVRPPSLLSGMIASAATCQVSATYANPGFIVSAVFSARRIERELDEGDELMQRLIFRRLAGRKAAGEVLRAVLNRESPVHDVDIAGRHQAKPAGL